MKSAELWVMELQGESSVQAIRQIQADAISYAIQVSVGSNKSVTNELANILNHLMRDRKCRHAFFGSDRLCRKCGLYFPETSTDMTGP